MKKTMTIIAVAAVAMMLAMPMNAFAEGCGPRHRGGDTYNTDINVTDNVAVGVNQVGAEDTQGQGQGQDQGQSIDDHSVTTIIDRKFVAPGVVPMAHTQGFYAAPTEDSSLRSIFELVALDNKFSDGAVDNLARKGKVSSRLQVVNDDAAVKRVTYAKDEVPMIQVIILKKGDALPAGFKMTGFIDGEAKNATTNSFQVAGVMMKKVLADGNNCIIFTKEGGHRGVFARGFGIGFYTAAGKVSADGSESGTVGGGFGYSQNNSGAEEKPWLQGIAGVLN